MITRRKIGTRKITKFEYFKNNKKIHDKKTLERIRKLRIPPMWINVNVSPNDTDYLQVTGKDSKNRTQYIYHPLFKILTDIEKYDRLRLFCKNLHLLDKKIEGDMKKYCINDKLYIIALMFKIIKKTHSRIGNECYSTYGLTTLEKKHMKITGEVIFDFIGKKNVRQILKFKDKKIARDLKKLTLVPGKRLFKTNKLEHIKSNDMNEYLKQAMGPEFTCKDFRTYASNVLFIEKLCSVKEIPKTIKAINTVLKNIYDEVAKELGHTIAISKKSYVMPIIEEKYREKPIFFNKKDPSKLLVNFLNNT